MPRTDGIDSDDIVPGAAAGGGGSVLDGGYDGSYDGADGAAHESGSRASAEDVEIEDDETDEDFLEDADLMLAVFGDGAPNVVDSAGLVDGGSDSSDGGDDDDIGGGGGGLESSEAVAAAAAEASALRGGGASLDAPADTEDTRAARKNFVAFLNESAGTAGVFACVRRAARERSKFAAELILHVSNSNVRRSQGSREAADISSELHKMLPTDFPISAILSMRKHAAVRNEVRELRRRAYPASSNPSWQAVLHHDAVRVEPRRKPGVAAAAAAAGDVLAPLRPSTIRSSVTRVHLRDLIRGVLTHPLLLRRPVITRIPKVADDFAGDLWRSTETVRAAWVAHDEVARISFWPAMKAVFAEHGIELSILPWMIAQGHDGAAVGLGLSVTLHPVYQMFQLLKRLRCLPQFMPMSAIIDHKRLKDAISTKADKLASATVFQRVVYDAMLKPFIELAEAESLLIADVTGMLEPAPCGASIGDEPCKNRRTPELPDSICARCHGGIWPQNV
jgi:hypothetical protein